MAPAVGVDRFLRRRQRACRRRARPGHRGWRRRRQRPPRPSPRARPSRRTPSSASHPTAHHHRRQEPRVRACRVSDGRMLVAEELSVDWEAEAEPGPAEYGPTAAGGSTSTPTNWGAWRGRGAAGRWLLIAAAAATWVYLFRSARPHRPVCTIVRLEPIRSGHGASWPMRAASLPAPDLGTVALKDPKDYTILGKCTPASTTPASSPASPSTPSTSRCRACLMRCSRSARSSAARWRP